jgi:hypothetical protein
LADHLEVRFIEDGAYYPEAAYIFVVYLFSTDEFAETY